MRLFQPRWSVRGMFLLSFALVLLLASPAYAWDFSWDSVVRKFQEFKAPILQRQPASSSGTPSAHRKPEIRLLGPLTFYVGESNIKKDFSADPNAKYRLHASSQSSLKADLTLDGKHLELVFDEHGKCDDERLRRVQLNAQNTLVVNKITGKAGGALTISIATTDIVLPPNPVATATPIDPTHATDIASSTAFLYSGPNPIQTGVDAETILPMRTSVLRGQVFDADSNPLSGVLVQVKDHPEFGQTLTRTDGAYDMVVNAGGELVLTFQKVNFLPAQRHLIARLRDFTVAKDPVLLIPVDSAVTKVTVGAGAPAQTAVASTQTDASGSRKAVVYFPAGTKATMKLSNGTTQSVGSLNIRATEFTVGPQGPKKMPADLPATSAYTYAVSLTADEEISAQASTVEFSQPVYHYVDNFLGLPAGTTVPVGFYDEVQSKWVAVDNGLVIKVLSVKNGVATIDVKGSGSAATAADLAKLNISSTELATFGSLYAAGKSFWRSPIWHFSTYDLNLGLRESEEVKLARGKNLDSNQNPDCPICHGSIIETENQVLGEEVAIAGTPFYLRYSSARIADRKSAYTARIPITLSSVESWVVDEVLRLAIAGRVFYYKFPPIPNQTFEFEWDGKDVYGRPMIGSQELVVQLIYEYDATYANSDPVPNVFAVPVFTSFPTPIPARQVAGGHIDYNIPLGIIDPRTQGLGGWTLNVHHAYDTNTQTLYQGDGTIRKASNTGSVADTFAGGGPAAQFFQAGSPATQVQLISPGGTAQLADQRVVLVDRGGYLRVVGTDGIITTLGGDGPLYDFQNQPVQQAEHFFANELASVNNEIYFLDFYDGRISKVDKNQIVRPIAGGGSLTPSQIPTDALQLNIAGTHFAVAMDGTVFIADYNLGGILRVGTDGRAILLPGTNGVFPADAIRSMACAPDGHAIYMTLNGVLQSFDVSSGAISRITSGLSQNEYLLALATNPNGDLFATSSFGHLYKIENNQAILIPITTELNSPFYLSVLSTGEFLVTELQQNRVKKISPSLPLYSNSIQRISSADGSEIFEFDASGKHLRTRDSLTNAVIYAFEYDSVSGNLIAVHDLVGNITSFQRNSQGNVVGITSPFGVRTQFAENADGYLSAVTDALGNQTSLGYIPGTGLLNRFTRPSGFASVFSYDSKNRLSTDTDAAGNKQSLARADVGADAYQIQYTGASGVKNQSLIQKDDFNNQTINHWFADGSQESISNIWGGPQVIHSADQSTTQSVEAGDPRFGFAAPYISSLDIVTPSGLASHVSRNKSVSYRADSSFVLTENTIVNGNSSLTTFDSATKTWQSTSAMGIKSSQVLDVFGRVTTLQVPGQPNISFSYDSKGRLSSVTQGERASFYSYDNNGYLASVTNPLGQTTSFVNDLIGRVLAQTSPSGEQTQFNYDRDGNVTSITPPSRPNYVLNFDVLGQMSAFTPPVLNSTPQSTSYAYTADRKIASITRPDGSSLQYQYNPTTGKLAQMLSPVGNTSFTYNSTTGQVAQITKTNHEGSNVQMDFQWDGFLPTFARWSGAVNATAQRAYDNNFRPHIEYIIIQVNGKDVGGSGILYSYDTDGRYAGNDVSALTRDPISGLPMSSLTRDYMTQDPIQENYTYNSFAELNADAVKALSGIQYYSASLSRDSLGRIVSKDETVLGKSHQYSYDGFGRLQTSTRNGVTTTYTYGPNGNRMSKSDGTNAVHYSYNDQDQLLSQGNITYTYTINGERNSRTDTSTGQTTLYRYDTSGNLIGATLPDGRIVDYILDGRNQRVGKKINGVLVETYIFVDGYGVSSVVFADGTAEAYEYNQNRALELVYRQTFAGKLQTNSVNRVIVDERGSPVRAIQIYTPTSDAQSVVKDIEYDEFGNIVSDTNPGFLHIGFAGCLYDSDTKLCHFGARDYDPETGRWTSKDPILFGGGDTNLYGYTFNDPVNLIDPSGLRFTFSDPASQTLFNNLRNNPALSSSARQMIDDLESSNSTINIESGTCSNRPDGGTFGRTQGYKGNNNSSVEIWSSSNSIIDQGTLLHELVHANQIRLGQPVTEPDAYRVGNSFLRLFGR